MSAGRESGGRENSIRENSIRVRALRGAITVARDDAVEVTSAAREMLVELLARNGITQNDVISAFFTVTPDIRSEFPARAARDLGWGAVPMLCSIEMPVPGALPLCIRVLMHVELPDGQAARHAYLRDADTLRPDL